MGRLVLFFILVLFSPSGFAVEKGGIEYSPYEIDYSKLDIINIEKNAETSFYQATNNILPAEEKLKYTTQALGDYKLLFSANPNNIDYCIRIAELYDLLKKDRYAKEYFYRGITLNPNSALPFEKFGNFYFSRQQFRLALKQYSKAYSKDSNIYNVNNQLGTIYQKFGDTRAALKYFKQAQKIEPSDQLTDKIRLLEELNSDNAVYYQNTRVHFVED